MFTTRKLCFAMLLGLMPCVFSRADSTPLWTPPDAFIAKNLPGWPEARTEARPGAYWWWPGNAVTKRDLTWNLETYRRAGWGNMGVVGIYGVQGEEERFIDIFSPKWFEMYNHAVREAKRLGMNIDLTPGSGWRLGGPHITRGQSEQSFSIVDGQLRIMTRSDKVKRAGPGGQGLCANPYSRSAVAFHFNWLAQRFEDGKGLPPRAFYYDSFENLGNWCPEFLESFKRLRGYDLGEHLEALGGNGEADDVRRVLCDYRETLSDLLLEQVDWIVRWSQERGSSLRMQAHGAPANLLDMYAAAGIPETEVFGSSFIDIPGYRRERQWIREEQQSDLVNRFASSAAHVTGRPLVISESFTWLRNHFHTALSHIKAESDKLWLNGINGIYYHGVCFAPEETEWPGWLFYASTQANARNSIFRDIPALNAYVTRCQSVLQAGRPFNDILLYWPIYDLWMKPGRPDLRFRVHHPEWIEDTPCGTAARWLIDNGYTFDFVSDRQLGATTFTNGLLRTPGGMYRAVLVPAADCMPVETAERLARLAGAGAEVLVWKRCPDTVPGWREHADRKKRLDTALEGSALRADDNLENLVAGIPREELVDHGLRFIRRSEDDGVSYFIVNHSARTVDGWVRPAFPGVAVELMDPLTGRTGLAPSRKVGGYLDVHLQMEPGETRLLRVRSKAPNEARRWPVRQLVGEPIPVTGAWQVSFTEGGPVLPKAFVTGRLVSWTELGDEETKRFAGAAQYEILVDLPEQQVDGWRLDLGDVRESARVWVNGLPAGLVFGHPFRLYIQNGWKPGRNKLVIEVTNLSANRIRDLDRRGVHWKKFYDINFVNHHYEPFDASSWDLKPSGLLGPVTLQAFRHLLPSDTSNGMPVVPHLEQNRAEGNL